MSPVRKLFGQNLPSESFREIVIRCINVQFHPSLEVSHAHRVCASGRFLCVHIDGVRLQRGHNYTFATGCVRNGDASAHESEQLQCGKRVRNGDASAHESEQLQETDWPASNGLQLCCSSRRLST